MDPFKYETPPSVADAVRLAGGEAKLLAGGQSLLPAMKLGLAAPPVLVDLNGISELREIRQEAGRLVLGAMATHASVAASTVVQKAIPALAWLANNIGDRQVRHRGTIGGSLANNDPAACYPAAVLALGATVRTDRRSIEADDFFRGLYETALADGEMITSVSFPIPERAAYMKFKQPASRFALVGVFVAKATSGVRVAVTGAAACVFRVPELEARLAVQWSPDACEGVTVKADELNSDLHGSARYRAALIPVLARRAVAAC
jgi:carbon-monoxide dehydrogenase medium subunit